MLKNIIELKKYSSLTGIKTFSLVVMLFISNFLDLFGLLFFIPIIDSLNQHSSNVTLLMNDFITSIGLNPTIEMYLIIMASMFLLKGILSFIVRLYTVEIASVIHYNLRKQIYSAIIDAKLGFINQQKQGSLLSVINEHTVRSGHAFFTAINIIIALITVVIYTILIFFISYKLAAITIGMALVLFPLIKWLGLRAYTNGKLYVNSLEDLQHYSLETFQSKKLINAMGWKSYMEKSFTIKSGLLKENWKWNAFYSNSPTIVIQPYSMIILASIMWGAIEFGLSLGLLGAFALAFMRLLPSLQQSGNFMTDLKASQPSILKVLDFLNSAKNSKEKYGEKKIDGVHENIKLENISFRYDEKHLILNNLSLDIDNGKTIALVGPSGGGKTTTVDLILGLQKPTKGNLFIDGTEISNIDLKSLRKKISYVSQDAVFFNDTIYNNLIIGLENDVSQDKIKQLCKDVGAWEFIKTKESGLEEIIGDRGVKLSGGQKQKLNLVRALLREPSLLILDEATSALDNESENDIKNVMMNLNHQMTIIVIAHRFETIKHADKIYLIKDGKAEDLGTWESAEKILKQGDFTNE